MSTQNKPLSLTSKPIAFLVLAFSSTALGALVGALTAGFLHLLEWGEHLLWQVLTPGLPAQALIICTLGGLLVGLCQRYLGDHPKGIYDAVAEIRKTGRLEYHHLPQGVTTVLASLIFGGSLGPEAGIIDMAAGLSTWTGDVIRTVRGKVGLVLPESPAKGLRVWLRRWPNLLALAAGAFAFLSLLQGLYGGGFLNPGIPFHWTDLLWSIPMGLLGAAAGWLFLFLQDGMRKAIAPLHSRPVLRGVLGGLVFGLIALPLPLVLFSGQHELQNAYNEAAQLGIWVLLLTALARLFSVNLLLSSGWKGGQFLPILFGAAALGLAASLAFPVVPSSAAVLAVMAGLISVVLPSPVIALVLMALMFPFQYVGISAVAVGVVALVKRLQARKTGAAQPASVPAEAD